MVRDSRTPCVHVMELSPNPELHCVGFSQREAATQVARHLLARGRKRIAFVGAQLDPRTMERAEGFRAALREARCYDRSEEHTSELQSLMHISYAVLCLKKKTTITT